MPGGSYSFMQSYDGFHEVFPALTLSSESSSPLQNTTFPNANCSEGIQFIWNVLGECVLTNQHLVAVIFGIISIIAWMLNSIPQVYENCKLGIPDEAMSPWLLIFWTTGDTCNMIGCFLAHQLVLQTAMAGYAIIADLILIFQYVYAFIAKKKREYRGLSANIQEFEYSDDTIDSISVRADRSGNRRHANNHTVAACFVSFFGIVGFTGALPLLNSNGLNVHDQFHSRNLLWSPSQFFLNDINDYIGYSLGCVSAGFYFSARIPQLVKNVQRGSLTGLSVGLFLLALVGNLTYSLQIFLTSTDTVFLMRHIPWIIGSLGVLSLDLVMLAQFVYYRNSPSPSLTFMVESIQNEHSPLISS